MRVLVTGAAGYLGGAVVHELLRAGHRVSGLVWHRAGRFPDAVEVHHGDVSEPDSLLSALRGVHAVVHLVALTRVRESFARPAHYYRVNVGGTANVLEALTSAAATSDGRPRLVFASTASVYGAPTVQPVTEDCPPDPRNPYAASKLAAEDLIGWQAAAGAFGAVSLRICNLAGSADGTTSRDDSRLIARALAVALGEQPRVDLHGDGSAIRDYVHVLDVAAACTLALNAAEPGQHRIFNLGAIPASVSEVLAAARTVTGHRIPVHRLKPGPGEVPELRVDATRFRAATGWQPQHTDLSKLIRSEWLARQNS